MSAWATTIRWAPKPASDAAGGIVISEAVNAAEAMRRKLLAAGANLALPGQGAGAIPENNPGTAR